MAWLSAGMVEDAGVRLWSSIECCTSPRGVEAITRLHACRIMSDLPTSCARVGVVRVFETRSVDGFNALFGVALLISRTLMTFLLLG
jgi:hypothetical protein